MPSEVPFGGAKILLFHKDQIVTYLRDDKPGIPYRALWDLPGGGREGDETPLQCALRETKEEFALSIPEDRIIWSRSYPSTLTPNTLNWFFVAPITSAEIATIAFGDEGQHWCMMPLARYLHHPQAIPHLQSQIQDYLAKEV